MMDQTLLDDLKKSVKGEVLNDPATLSLYSHDASIFELKPEVVIAPRDSADIQSLVNFVSANKEKHSALSLTPRSGGTDMSGGALSESIVLSFTQHMNNVGEVADCRVYVQPGAYYRDFEKKTLEKNCVFPAYPVSKDICALGGMIGNNCGGEKSLEYGKADRYVKKMKMVLSDGREYGFEALNEEGLKEKLAMTGFEGDLYRKIYGLINDNYNLIKKAKPTVSKNSSGYGLWDVYDRDAKIFDLTKLFVGSQGTLGIMTEATLELVPLKKHSEMVVIMMNDSDIPKLGKIINTVLPFRPESFETYDDNTLRLAIKYFAEFGKKMGTNMVSTAINFLPEFLMLWGGKLPKLVLQAEFTGDDPVELRGKSNDLMEKLKQFNLKVKLGGDENSSKKYWLIRRESFALLKNKIKDMHASPFIDDIAVEPKYLSEFLPKLNVIMAKYPTIISTLAGHIGDGNFHIIPLVKLQDPLEHEVIKNLSKEVFDLVFEYHGSNSGEHNDGIIRTAYLKPMFGNEIYNLFVETKKIFDPANIFNPGKKIDISMDYFMNHIRRNW